MAVFYCGSCSYLKTVDDVHLGKSADCPRCKSRGAICNPSELLSRNATAAGAELVPVGEAPSSSAVPASSKIQQQRRLTESGQSTREGRSASMPSGNSIGKCPLCGEASFDLRDHYERKHTGHKSVDSAIPTPATGSLEEAKLADVGQAGHTQPALHSAPVASSLAAFQSKTSGTSSDAASQSRTPGSGSGKQNPASFFKRGPGQGFLVEGGMVSLLILFCVVPWFGFSSWIQALIAAVLLGYLPFILVAKEPALDEPMTAALFLGVPISAICLLVSGVMFGFGGKQGSTGGGGGTNSLDFVNERVGLTSDPFYDLKDELKQGRSIDAGRLLSAVGQPAYKSIRSNGQRWFYREVKNGGAVWHITVFLDKSGTRVEGIETKWPPFWPSTKQGLDDA